jgi:bifunctional oligoribonuclease and PAP phosphatase NrnA
MIIDRVIAKLTSFNKILLMIHENPDGDTLGSATVLFNILHKLGKEPAMVCKDSIPRPFLFLPEIENIQRDMLFGDYEVIVVIDCGDMRRTGFADRLREFSQKKKILINIDHHPKNDLHKITQLNLVDFKASSTAEIVWGLLQKLDIQMDKDIATALFTGLYTDTGGFKHSNTSPKTLEIAAELLRHGARIKLITKNVSLNKSISAMKLWGIALSRLHYSEQKITSAILTRADLKKCQASDDDISGVVNLINTIPDSRVAILFYETIDGKIRASIRTEQGDVDVSRLARVFGGGGHKKASGFTIDGILKPDETGKWKIVLK